MPPLSGTRQNVLNPKHSIHVYLACVVASARHVQVLSAAILQGGWEGACREARVALLFFLRPETCLAGVPASETAEAETSLASGPASGPEVCLAGVPASQTASKGSFSKCHEVVAVAHNQREHGTGDAIKRDGLSKLREVWQPC